MKGEKTGLDGSRTLLEELGFEHAPHLVAELMEKAVREDLSYSAFLEDILRKEREFREERRIKTSLKLSGLPQGKTLDTFDFTFQRSVGRKEIELLATCEYIRRKENVLFLGPPGVGKSHLAAALGVKGVENGFSVTWLTADELLKRLRRDEQDPGKRNRRRTYLSSSVLIIDELGFQDLDRRDAHLFFHLVSSRYERNSTVITSNKSVREWPEMLAGDEILATAILDRLLHHCHIVHVDGSSYRLWEMEHRTRSRQGKEGEIIEDR